MIKRIKGSLTIKIFIVTGLLLILCCTLTYGFIAWLMPKTYSESLEAVLDQRVQNFISDLEMTTLEDSQDLFDFFVLSNDVDIQLHNSLGQAIPIPSKINPIISNTSGDVENNDSGADTAEMMTDTPYETDISSMSAAQNYYFTLPVLLR